MNSKMMKKLKELPRDKVEDAVRTACSIYFVIKCAIVFGIFFLIQRYWDVKYANMFLGLMYVLAAFDNTKPYEQAALNELLKENDNDEDKDEEDNKDLGFKEDKQEDAAQE